MNISQINEMKALLSSLYKQPIPMMSGSVTLQMVKLSRSLIPLNFMTFFPPLFFFCIHGLACCVFVSEGDKLVVSKEVSPQVEHQGVSPTGVCVVCHSQSRN